MFLLTIAIFALLIGHVIKVYRWGLFIDLYEKPSYSVLLKSLALSHAINIMIPFHIGDIYRIWYSGKRMLNGVKFSLATIVVEHYIDLIVLASVCLILYFMGHNTMFSAVLLLTVATTLILLPIATLHWDKKTKHSVVKIAKFFNPDIELRILGIVWTFVSIFKKLVSSISKTRFLTSTIFMWACYMLSYWSIAECLQEIGIEVRLRNVIDIFFSFSTLTALISYSSESMILLCTYLIVYISTPLIIIYIASYFYGKRKASPEMATNRSVIPHVSNQNALNFLETFFSGNMGGAFLKGFLEVNKDVSILEDYSAGSNAVTLLCTNGNKTFFRKFAIGEDGSKLFQQMTWINSHQNQIPLPIIENFKKENEYCSYDMPFNKNAVNFFTFIHTRTFEESWKLLKSILDDLREHLYNFEKKADSSVICKYYEEKIEKNLRNIKQSSVLSDILQYDDIYINGVRYKNLKCLESLLEKIHLSSIFSNSPLCTIHGDLTIENIICTSDGYYLIDPNVGNILECPYLDLAKLFQSLHGGYEFLMRTQNVSVNGNRIDYPYICSSAYQELYNNLCQYIKDNYGHNVLSVIYYHELVHWLRLMPYKIEKRDNAIVFYSGFIKLLNELS